MKLNLTHHWPWLVKWFFFQVLLFSVFQANAETHRLYGSVTDLQGNPLPFATVYINHSTQGTTTNIEGNFGILLEAGSYELVFQYVGYKKKLIDIQIINADQRLDVRLESEALQLKEIVVTSGKEDPAYPVIRAAIAKRKYHANEVQAYQCQVYIKGIQTLNSRPDKVFGYTVPVDTGIVYLSESISELSFEKPDKIKEKMISSKVSGNISTFSYNQGSQMLFSFYDNLVQVTGLSERSFISPIAANALLFYDYKLEGIIQENDILVNKIKVLPKRKNDPAFEGYIYIIEDLWRIHSTELTLTKDHQIEFLDILKINQVYAPVDYGIWMMISQAFNYELNAFGFNGEGNFIGVHSNYKIQPNVELINKEREKTKSPNLSNTPSLFEKDYFDEEVLLIEDESNKKTEAYWQEIRPVPLTEIEKADYKKNDSLKTIYNSKAYKDSVDQYVNKISLQNIIYSGYTHQDSFLERYYAFNPIIRSLLYNTVEGFTLDFKLKYAKYNNEVISHRIIPEIRYGFSSGDVYGQIRTDLYFNPKRFSKIYFSIGRFVSQFNNDNPVLPFVNTMETLVRAQNLIKLYEKDYLKIGFRNEIKNGLLIETNLEYANRSQLFNTSNYSFFDNEEFTSNQPVNIELMDTSFDPYQAMNLFVKLRIDFKRKYISRPDTKILLDSKYPRLEIYYKKGIPLLGSETNFDNISTTIAGNLSLGLLGSSQYTVQAGTFINNSNVKFPDFTHFNTNQSVIGRFGQYRFELLDYYQHSTTSGYFIAHYRHHFNGFIINKFPLLRKTKVQTVASLSYLTTQTTDHYLEYGIGLEHILKLFRAGFYTSTLNTNHYASGIRIGLGF